VRFEKGDVLGSAPLWERAVLIGSGVCALSVGRVQRVGGAAGITGSGQRPAVGWRAQAEGPKVRGIAQGVADPSNPRANAEGA